ncbi:MAG: hypothetical protein P8074_21075 [Anaerolineales bacterium]
MPVAVATSALGMVGSTVIPGIELAMDWRQGKQESESKAALPAGDQEVSPRLHSLG